MKNIEEYLKIAINKGACPFAVRMIKSALKNGNKLLCYQIALGNIDWLLYMGVISIEDITELEKLAHGTGLLFNEDGQLHSKTNYKEGELYDLYKSFYDNSWLCRSKF